MTIQDKEEHYKRYGWEVNEENLSTLPATAPQAARDLTKWLTLEGRRKQLEDWLANQNRDTNSIHGKFWPIGAWTHRMAHTSPNAANIVSVFSGTPTTPVEEVKEKYDGEMRSCWEADPGTWLVGTDADGIQLRILCHYTKSAVLRDAIVSGDKSMGTDIHSMNQKALGPICKSRDDAKRFIYSWLLGAGIPKIASILGCTMPQAKQAVDNFLSAYPELKRLKNVTIPRDAARGYFIGLDGRRVQCDSEHLMLAGYLQNGETVVMKHSNVRWRKELDELGYEYKQVNFVHDEWQTVVYGIRDDASAVGHVQEVSIREIGHDLNLFCPLDGSYSIGKNWKETH